MRARFGFSIVMLAAVALIAIADESQAGRRCRGCGTWYSSCADGACTVPAPAAQPAAAAEDAAAQAPAKAPANVASAEGEPEPSAAASSAPQTRRYYVGRRGWRRWRR